MRKYKAYGYEQHEDELDNYGQRLQEGFACMVSIAFVVAAVVGAVCYFTFK